MTEADGGPVSLIAGIPAIYTSLRDGRSRRRHGRRRLHRRPPDRAAARARTYPAAVDRREADRRVVPALRRRREPPARSPAPRGLQGGVLQRATGLPVRVRHGRHGLHRDAQGRVHALGADQHAHAGRGQGRRRRAFLLLVVRLRLPRRQAARRRRHAVARVRRPSGRSGRRLRLGEALFRAHVPALPRGLRAGDPDRPVPQRLRARRRLGRRAGEGAGRDLPQGGPCARDRRAHHRDLGRRRPDPLVHVRRRLHRGHLAPHGERRRRPAQRRLRRAGDDRRPRRRRRGGRGRVPRAPLPARRSARRHGAQFGQHPDPA